MKFNVFFILGFLLPILLFSSQPIFDFSGAKVTIIENQFNMGNPGPPGREIKTNNHHLTLGGKSWLPVMGEMHFSRVPREFWRENLLKMKTGGIDIVATYVFWNHHEEIQGEFDFSGQRDLRAFVKLCHELGLLVWLRIGPWDHGEVRNGGFPDWLLKKPGIILRSMDKEFIGYVDRLYDKIGMECAGLNYGDGGAIIGVQLENEFYVGGKDALNYIMHLKQSAINAGFDLPLYSMTLWPQGPDIPPYEFVLLSGGYAATPWSQHINPVDRSDSYRFRSARIDSAVGSDLIKDISEENPLSVSIYPYYTCEIGAGNQISHHRRPILSGMDGAANAFTKIGSGCNLPGYYMFSGGLNPTGKLTTLQESRETSYPNDYPIVSYDFQTALLEYGQTSPVYHELKPLHYFLNDYGSLLAKTGAFFPAKDSDGLNYAIRTDGKHGFVFLNQYNRYQHKQPFRDVNSVQFKIKLNNQSVTLPSTPITIYSKEMAIWPIAVDYEGIELKYATATPITQHFNGDRGVAFFYRNPKRAVEFCFAQSGLQIFCINNCEVVESDGGQLVSSSRAGSLSFDLVKGDKRLRIEVIDQKMAKQFYVNRNSKSRPYWISENELYFDKEQVKVNSFKSSISLSYYDLKMLSFVEKESQVMPLELGNTKFNQTKATLPSKEATQISLKKGEVYYKEVEIKNASKIKSAIFYLSTKNCVTVKINGKPILFLCDGAIFRAGIGGYLKPGVNELTIKARANISFCYEWVTTFENRQAIKILSTSQQEGIHSCQLLPHKLMPNETLITLNSDLLSSLDRDDIKNFFLEVHFVGDSIELLINQNLAVDQYYAGFPWQVSLAHFKKALIKSGGQFELRVDPLTINDHIYFEVPVSYLSAENGKIQSIQIKTQYQHRF